MGDGAVTGPIGHPQVTLTCPTTAQPCKQGDACMHVDIVGTKLTANFKACVLADPSLVTRELRTGFLEALASRAPAEQVCDKLIRVCRDLNLIPEKNP